MNGKYGHRAASWSDGTGHARHRRHVDGVIGIDTVEDEGRTEQIPACATRRVVAEKKGEENTRGERGGHRGTRDRVCVRIRGTRHIHAVYKRAEKTTEWVERGTVGLLSFGRFQIGLVSLAVAHRPRRRKPVRAIHRSDPRKRSFVATKSCSGRNGKSLPSSSSSSSIATDPAVRLAPAIHAEFQSLISVFSKEHDHSSFYKFLQMEHNHKNLDCYFFYYSTCKKVRTTGPLVAPLSPLLAPRALIPGRCFRRYFESVRHPKVFVPYCLGRLVGLAEVRSAILMSC